MARLTIGSWNVGTSNTELSRVIAFILNEKYDVLCLQEVSEELLDRLKSFDIPDLTIRSYKGLVRQKGQDEYPGYIVIISRVPGMRVKTWAYPSYPRPPLRAQLFIWLAERLGKWDGTTIARWGMYADIFIDGYQLRVFNLHLTLLTPERRRQEFLLALKYFESGRTVICGDLNILESPKVQWLNGVLGSRLAYVFDLHRERREMEELFRKKKLWNPLSRSATQKKSGSQLDHILLPKASTSNRVPSVYPEYLGSDHKPVFVEFDFEPPAKSDPK